MEGPIRTHRTASHRSGMPLQREADFSGARIPDFERGIHRCRDNEGPIRTHRTASHPIGMPLQGEAGLSSARIPDFERLIGRCRDNEGPIGTHRTAADTLSVCPCRVRRACPVRASQTLSVVSRMSRQSRSHRDSPHSQSPPPYARAG